MGIFPFFEKKICGWKKHRNYLKFVENVGMGKRGIRRVESKSADPHPFLTSVVLVKSNSHA